MSQSPLLIYLHGFISSPKSEKAQETIRWAKQHRPDIEVMVPTLADKPSQTIPQLLEIFEELSPRKPALIGSSMGGFHSAWLSAQFDLRAVLVNPGTYIAERLKTYVGENTNMYSGETFELTIDDLKALERQAKLEPNQQNLKILLQTGDETLDYRDALKRFPEAHTTVEQGGNHRFENYDKHLPEMIEFLQL